MNESPAGEGQARRGILPEAEEFIGRWIGRYTDLLAIIGGLVLTGVMLLAVVSIIGRGLARSGLDIFNRGALGWVGPIPGDFELVSMGAGIAIFCFLSWAHFQRGHVTVDIFVSKLGPRGLAWLSVVTNLLLTIMVVILAQKVGEGLDDKMRFRETTQILEIPVWYKYVGGMAGLWSFALVSGYSVWRSLNEALGAGEPAGGGA